ncbi:hypothetical protein [Roseomonas gilardii]|uniref:hypothetical protein n=1 Tax=Roseomonas gilardii TaxID=257708 RepID=UPI0012EC55DD|nr:hypothetical protein [Roseomonas gilardii]
MPIFEAVSQRSLSAKSNRYRLIALFIFLVITLLLFEAQLAGAFGQIATTNPPTAYKNYWISQDANGNKTYNFRWSLGTPEKIVTMQIPLSYVDFPESCGTTTSGEIGGNCRQPYALAGPLLRVLLPDLETIPDKGPRVSTGRALSINMTSATPKGFGPLKEALRRLAYSGIWRVLANMPQSSSQSQHTSEDHPLTYREDRAGMARIGVKHVDVGEAAIRYHDFLYLPTNNDNRNIDSCKADEDPLLTGILAKVRICQEWAAAKDFMICNDEAVATRETPGAKYRPLCTQYFGIDEIDAVVWITYERQHQKEWRSIKEKVTALLLSFVH